MKVALVGLGAVGTRVARQLLADPEVSSLVLIHRGSSAVPSMVDGFVPLSREARDPLSREARDPTSRGLRDPLSRDLRASQNVGDAGDARDGTDTSDPRVEVRRGLASEIPNDTDVVVLTQPEGVREAAEVALHRGAHVVATVDDPAEVRRLLALGSEARRQGRSVVVGAAMAPGLSCVLARYGAAGFDTLDQVHVCSLGTGGPACARRHHDALSSSVATDWVAGEWRRRPVGSGRELVWFPEPAGGADCYRAGLIDPVLLVPAFPGVQRVTARLAATRRDRATSWLPMLRHPHPEGLVGAVRVELRGWRHGVAETRIFGATSRPAVIAGAVAAVAATWAGSGRLSRPGSGGLAELVDEPGAFLRQLHARGIATVRFEGSEPDDGGPEQTGPGFTEASGSGG